MELNCTFGIGIPIFEAKSRVFESVASILEFSDNRTFVILSFENCEKSDEILRILLTAMKSAKCEIGVVIHDERLGLVKHWNFLLDMFIGYSINVKYFAWGSDHDLWSGDIKSIERSFSSKKDVVLVSPTSFLNRNGTTKPIKDNQLTNRVPAYQKRIGQLPPGFAIYSFFKLETIQSAEIKMRRVLLPDRLFLTELTLYGVGVGGLNSAFMWTRREKSGKQGSVRKVLSSQRQKLFGSDRLARVANIVPWFVFHLYKVVRHHHVIVLERENRNLFKSVIYFILLTYVSHLKKLTRQSRLLKVFKVFKKKFFVRFCILKTKAIIQNNNLMASTRRKKATELLQNLENWKSLGLNSAINQKLVFMVLRSLEHYPYVESLVSKVLTAEHKILIIDASGKYKVRAKLKNSISGEELESLRKLNTNLAIVAQPRHSALARFFVESIDSLKILLFYWNNVGFSIMPSARWEKRFSERNIRILRVFFAKSPTILCKTVEIISRVGDALVNDNFATNLLDKLNPDVVFVTPGNMAPNFEGRWISFCQKRGIRTVIPILSWDNPHTKGPFNYKPDLIFAWDEAQKSVITCSSSIESGNIIVSGGLHLDRFRRPTNSAVQQSKQKSSHVFHVLYLCSSFNVVQDETEIILRVYKELKSALKIKGKDCSFVLRPHPANKGWHSRFAEIEGEGIHIAPKAGVIALAGEEIDNFNCQVSSSQLILGLSTSAMLEASLCSDVRIASLAQLFPGAYANDPHLVTAYEQSVFAFPRNFEELVELTGTVKVRKSSHFERKQRASSVIMRELNKRGFL